MENASWRRWYPTPNAELSLATDASDTHIRGVMQQNLVIIGTHIGTHMIRHSNIYIFVKPNGKGGDVKCQSFYSVIDLWNLWMKLFKGTFPPD